MSQRKITAPPTLLCDFYKVGHRQQYPNKTEFVFSTWIPRSNKHYPQAKSVIALNFQGFTKKYLIDYFNEHFFGRSKEVIVAEYVRYCQCCLFDPDPYTKHIEDLHDLGYMPLLIRSLPEGTRCPFRVPMLTVQNTDSRFFWVTNYVETLMSCELWGPSTTATIADLYKEILTGYAEKTSSTPEFVQFQGHDFSMRGGMGLEATQLAGIGHLTSFVGTDTISAIAYAENYYNANMEVELIGCSVPATEHSVMCAGGAKDELGTYKRLIQDVYPTGIISIVSDTWDLWHVVTDTLGELKDIIMARDGGPDSIDKVVIRPDSGNPVDIICGVPNDPVLIPSDPEYKGVVELLWDTFGGTINDKGYKELDPHIGAIYGDSITLDRCEAICHRLEQKGFASTNVVFGIGSYTYQYITRDSLGFAMKATSCTIDGQDHMLFKDPITDDGTKKSLKGACVVQEKDGVLVVIDNLTLEEANDNHIQNMLQVTFENSELHNETSLAEIRERINATR